MTLSLNGNTLTIADVVRIANDASVRIELAADSVERMRASRAVVDSWVERGDVVYGVTTGFGEFANVTISRENIELLQANLIRSHAAGAGEPIEPTIMRAMMAL